MTISLLLALALGAAEPVVWTKMADPDPHYVPPKVTAPQRPRAKANVQREREPDNLESALGNLEQAGREYDEAAIREFEREVREAQATIDRARDIADQSGSALDPPQR